VTADRPGAVLDEATIAVLLRECVTVVRPGELLVIRFAPGELDMATHDRYAQRLRAELERTAPGVQAVIVVGDELGVATMEPQQ